MSPISPKDSSSSPSLKRVKLESESPPPVTDDILDPAEGEDNCIICLESIIDRTVLPCAHDAFCFDCMINWTNQSRKCPLCTAPIGKYLIHRIRSQYDYQKHYLAPLRTSPVPAPPLRGQLLATAASRRRRQPPANWGGSTSREDDALAQDALDAAIEKRKWIYRHNLFAKHMASNAFTRYRPFPTPAQFAASPELISRATAFLRRELRVFVNLDVEFLTTFIVALLKSMDVRSEPAVRTLAEFLDLGGSAYTEGAKKSNAEHFAHELYTFLRSPYREISVYDSVVQYDVPETLAPHEHFPSANKNKWRPLPPVSEKKRSRSRPRSPTEVYAGPSNSRKHNYDSPQMQTHTRDSGSQSPEWCSPRDVVSRPHSHSPSRSWGGDRGDDDNFNRARHDLLTVNRDVKGKSKAIVDGDYSYRRRVGDKRTRSDDDRGGTSRSSGSPQPRPISDPTFVIKDSTPRPVPTSGGLSIRNAAARLAAESVAAPSLLVRMSDPEPTPPASNITPAPTPTLTPVQRQIPKSDRSSSSAKEIMARTRARLAKEKEKTAIYARSPFTGGDASSPALVVPSPNSGTGENTPSPGALFVQQQQIRQRLLARLEDQRRSISVSGLSAGAIESQADSADTPPLLISPTQSSKSISIAGVSRRDTTTTLDHGHQTRQGQGHSHPVRDIVQNKLNARLAAARKELETSARLGLGGSGQDDATQPRSTANPIKDPIVTEVTLKEQLMQRRRR